MFVLVRARGRGRRRWARRCGRGWRRSIRQLPLDEVRTLRQVVDDGMAIVRLAGDLLLLLGGVALALSALGRVRGHGARRRAADAGDGRAPGAGSRAPPGAAAGRSDERCASRRSRSLVGVPAAMALARVMAGALFGIVRPDASPRALRGWSRWSRSWPGWLPPAAPPRWTRWQRCTTNSPRPQPPGSYNRSRTMALSLRSPAFTHQGQIPALYTCEGRDISPALSWAGSLRDEEPRPDRRRSRRARSRAPGMTWVHWVLYNLPAGDRDCPRRSGAPRPAAGTREGLNDWKRTGYGGPARRSAGTATSTSSTRSTPCSPTSARRQGRSSRKRWKATCSRGRS